MNVERYKNTLPLMNKLMEGSTVQLNTKYGTITKTDIRKQSIPTFLCERRKNTMAALARSDQHWLDAIKMQG